MNFGNLRSTISAALENPERIDHVVYVLLGPMKEHEREVAMNYAKSHLEGVEVGTVGLWDLVVWCVGMGVGKYPLRDHLGVYHRDPCATRELNPGELREVASATAWGTVVVYTQPEDKLAYFVKISACWTVHIKSPQMPWHRGGGNTSSVKQAYVVNRNSLVEFVSVCKPASTFHRPEIPSHLH